MQQRRHAFGLVALVVAFALTIGGGTAAYASPASTAPQAQVNRSGGDLLHPTEAAGKYVWFCLSTNGSQYQIAEGTKLSVCKGSYLRAYLGGKFQYSVNLSEGGTIASPKADQIVCVIKMTKSVVFVLVAGRTSPWALVKAGASGVASAYSCRA